MSRVGRAPITIPAGVEVKVEAGNTVTVKGPKGTLTRTFNPIITIAQEGAEVICTRPDDSKATRSMHGTVRSILNGMVIGVSEGFTKELQVNGIGYRVSKEGNKLVMNLGFSHPVEHGGGRWHHHRSTRTQQDPDQGLRQAAGWSVRSSRPRQASSRTLQGQGHQVC